MKYFVIEIPKVANFASQIKQGISENLNKGNFNVIDVCDSYEEATKKAAQAMTDNVKNQTMLHHEIISEEDSHYELAKEISKL